MISLLRDLLSKQDLAQSHTLLTRLIVSFCICLAYIVLHGFYGLLASVVIYLFGVGTIGLPLQTMFYPLILGLLSGCWRSFLSLRDYWRNFGHATG